MKPRSMSPATRATNGGTVRRSSRQTLSQPAETTAKFVTASHFVLFKEEAPPACDVCGRAMVKDDDDGYGVSGSGLYLWTRDDGTVRVEEPGLCPSCGTAIGMSALLRWSVEEDEG